MRLSEVQLSVLSNDVKVLPCGMALCWTLVTPMVTAAPVVTAWSPRLLQPKHSPIRSITSGDQPAANLYFLCKCTYAEVSVKLGLISGALLSTS